MNHVIARDHCTTEKVPGSPSPPLRIEACCAELDDWRRLGELKLEFIESPPIKISTHASSELKLPHIEI